MSITAPVWGVIGVLIGALATGGLQWLLESRRIAAAETHEHRRRLEAAFADHLAGVDAVTKIPRRTVRRPEVTVTLTINRIQLLAPRDTHAAAEALVHSAFRHLFERLGKKLDEQLAQALPMSTARDAFLTLAKRDMGITP